MPNDQRNTLDHDTVLETERLIIRQWVSEDWLRMRELATNPMVLSYIGHSEPWTDDRIKKFVDGGIEMAKTRGWVLWPLIFRANLELIGFCGFNSGFAPEVEIGWRLVPGYWGKGLATEAAKALLNYGFQRFAFPRVISVAQPANVASINVMRKLGMRFEKAFVHDGIDVVCYVKENDGGPG